MDPKAEALVRRINEGTADIRGIRVDVCKELPVHEITPTSMYQFCDAIAADIFHTVGIRKDEAAECFDAISERIHNGRLLRDSTLGRYGGMNFLRHLALKVTTLHAKTGKTICIPAHAMGSMIAAIVYRKLRPTGEEFFRKNEDLVKVFGELNGIQWLPVAIQVWDKVKGRAFAIQLDENIRKPIPRLQKVDGKSLWVVTTRMPDVNKHGEVFRRTFFPAIPESGRIVPKTEPDENALPSIEPHHTSNEPIPLSDDEESEDNIFTLRDYTRQMKILGKRLATPDRAIARRARREMLKMPDQVGEQEVEEVGPPKEYFDSYTHLKDVWKTCLKNRVSIPNSLRVLVDHHCTPSQVFHLMELEKDHLAEMEMEIDG
ncbi:hypothetical protein FAGAP_2681 [Fusarium agapanthi]|uniref:Uncharacterized protein n=1 Tax=Fusarium agapanthi TaxID=1803897 RepID=A0A9P5E9S7_9HYPO|nr:hypothetical protein FAGAP_2681 [Fusarium agapanthi]